MAIRLFAILFISLFPLVVLAQDAPFNIGADSKEPIKISADELEVVQKNKIAEFKGNVVANQGRVKIRADKMRVYYRENNEKKSGEPGVSKIDVEGNVFLSTPEETAQGAKGHYDVDNQLVNLEGSVILTRGQNILKGKSLVYNMQTSKSQLIGGEAEPGKKQRVEGVFVPEKNSPEKKGN